MIKQYELNTPINTNGNVYVGIPRERLYIPYFVDNRDQILMTIQKAGRSCGYYQHEGHRVDKNRDGIVKEFLSRPDKPEWLQMLDTDMDHPRDISLRLSKWGKPIISGLYFDRKQSHDPFCFVEVEPELDEYGRMKQLWAPMRDTVYNYLTENRIPLADGALTVDDGVGEALVECDAVATGTMLIHRSVLELMKKPIFEYRPHGSSEDLVFCYEAKHDYGIPIHCDLSTISGHYIFSPQGQAQFRQKYERRGIALSGYTMSEAAKWLADFWGIEKELAEEKLKNSNAHMAGDYWKNKFGDKKVSSEDARKFYEEPYVGDLYLIELLHWNARQTFYQLKNLFVGLRNMKVLEIGAGIGSLAIQLSVQKCEVVASEINDTLLAFAEKRIEWVRERIKTELGQIKLVKDQWISDPENTYDAVACVDTFEHLTAIQAKKMLHDIARIIKPGGNLIYHANFAQQDLYPMHFDHSEMWDTWLFEAGFIPLSGTRALRSYDVLDS